MSNKSRQLLDKAGVFFYDGDLSSAIECYKEVLTINPESKMAFGFLGQSYWRLGQLAVAEHYLEEAVARKHFASYPFLALVLLDKQDILYKERVFNLLYHALHSYPSAPLASGVLSMIYEYGWLVSVDDEEALYYAKQAKDSYFFNVKNTVERLTQKIVHHTSYESLTQAQIVAEHIALADKCQVRQDYQEAMIQYQMALDIDPNQAEAWYQLALVYARKNSPDKQRLMRECLEKAVALHHNFAHARLAEALFREENPAYEERILALLDKAMTFETPSGLAYLMYGRFYVRGIFGKPKDNKTALMYYQKAKDTGHLSGMIYRINSLKRYIK